MCHCLCSSALFQGHGRHGTDCEWRSLRLTTTLAHFLVILVYRLSLQFFHVCWRTRIRTNYPPFSLNHTVFLSAFSNQLAVESLSLSELDEESLIFALILLCPLSSPDVAFLERLPHRLLSWCPLKVCLWHRLWRSHCCFLTSVQHRAFDFTLCALGYLTHMFG